MEEVFLFTFFCHFIAVFPQVGYFCRNMLYNYSKVALEGLNPQMPCPWEATKFKEAAKAVSLRFAPRRAAAEICMLKKETKNEAQNKVKKRDKCPYCGDAPISHVFSYANSFVSMFLDPILSGTSGLIPNFAVRGAEGILKAVFSLSRLLGAIQLKDDPEKAITLRSKVIWEEARRRGIEMRQVAVFGKRTDNFRAKVNGRHIYFSSIPLPPVSFYAKENWDDKFFLNKQLFLSGIPAPRCAAVPSSRAKREKLFQEFQKPVMIKPRMGSRGRHTTTFIRSFSDFEKGYELARKICPQTVAEEHLEGYVCRATCVGGKLVGFYRAETAKVIGDGKSTIAELILKKDAERPERVEKIFQGKESEEYLSRLGWKKEDIPPAGEKIELSHRTGRLFGGITKEMLPELHPSFVPILEKAAKITNLAIIGFDCIIPDPEKNQRSQRWGIIEGNTLPFIDLHYYALSGKPQNIAGLIWDLWQK